MGNIIIKHTSIIIKNYTLGQCPQLERALSLWSLKAHKYTDIAYTYDEDKHELLIPRGINIQYLESILHDTAEIEYTPDPYDTVFINLKTPPRNDVQRKAISFLIGEGDYKYTLKYSQLLVQLNPGAGKTYIAIAALSFIKTNTFIMSHREVINTQWRDRFNEFTNLTDDKICDIKGSKVIMKLMNTPYSKLKYKVYICNRSTINSFGKKYGWDKVSELFKHLKIGLKIIDEAHRAFMNTLMLDRYTNTKKTIYLTATFDRSDDRESKLFSQCFASVTKFISETLGKSDNVVYLAVEYDSKPSVDKEAYVQTYYGFSKTRYCEYMIESESFYKAIDYIMEKVMNMSGKILILLSKTEAVDTLTEYIKAKYPNKNVARYHSKVIDVEKSNATNSDIICSTPQSLGEGSDIKNIRILIMTEPYASKIMIDQVPGRLREYGEDKNSLYIELVDVGFKKVYRLYKSRLKVFKTKFKKILKYNL